MNISTTHDQDPLTQVTEPVEPGQEETTTPPIVAGKAALWLRWLGSFAVVSSAIVYMLQGLNQPDLDLRNWVYLAIMGLMAGCAFTASKLMQDSKGARLFFGLAMLLVPVQFSQLGGQLHEFMINAAPGATLFDWLPSALQELAIPIAATFACAIPITYAASAILARQDKARVSASLLLLSTALLITARDSYLGYGVLLGLVGATGWLRAKLLEQRSTYNNLDGLGLGVILASPMIIALVRLLTHIDEVTGWAGIGGIAAIVLTRMAPAGSTGNLPRFAGALLGVACWWIYLMSSSVMNGAHLSVFLLPVTVWLMDVARISAPHGRDYRATAMLFLTGTALSLLLEPLLTAANFYALALGLVAMTWGIFKNHREPTLVGALISLVSLLAITGDALTGVEVNSWIALGLLGIGLVFSASLFEKFGRLWLQRSRNAWQSVSQWD